MTWKEIESKDVSRGQTLRRTAVEVGYVDSFDVFTMTTVESVKWEVKQADLPTTPGSLVSVMLGGTNKTVFVKTSSLYWVGLDDTNLRFAWPLKDPWEIIYTAPAGLTG